MGKEEEEEYENRWDLDYVYIEANYYVQRCIVIYRQKMMLILKYEKASGSNITKILRTKSVDP